MSPPPEEIRSALANVVSSPGFASAGRLGPFLTFVVERALAGQPIKESIVGTEAFGRPADYDPRLDPIVRVEARRLRSRLAEYYRGAGADDALRIALPKGTYVPVFEYRTSTTEGSGGRHWLLWLATGLALAAGAAIAVATYLNRESAAGSTVAVLPFHDLTDGSGASFGEGLTEEIADRLSKIDGIRVAARSAIPQPRDARRDLRALGRGLGVAAIVEGSIRADGDRLRVTARLVNVENGYQLWSHSYERAQSDAFDLQDDIASAITAALRVELNDRPSARPARPSGGDDARDLYARARYHISHDAFPGLELGADCLEQAVEQDPSFAEAYAMLGETYAMLAYSSLRDANEAWAAARRSAERALALDPSNAEAHAVRGAILAHHEWRWAEAEPHLRRALELDPESSDVQILYVWAVLLPQGRLDEARPHVDAAVELDPDFSPVYQARGWVVFAAGEIDQAIKDFRRAAELNPSHPYYQWDLGMALAYAGRRREAMRQFRLAGNIVAPGSWDPGVIEHVLLGEPDRARAVLRGWKGFSDQRPILAAHAYGLLGDVDGTARWLGRAMEERDPLVVWVRIDPRFANVRHAAKIQAIIDRIGL